MAHFLAMLTRVLLESFCAFARGEYAMTVMPSLWQYSTQSSQARKGWVSIWFTTGAWSGRAHFSCSRWCVLKLATPIDLKTNQQRHEAMHTGNLKCATSRLFEVCIIIHT